MPLAYADLPVSMQRAASPTSPNGTSYAGRYTLVFRIRHKAQNRVLKEHRLILMPTTFGQETESRTSLYYTKGGVATDTPAKTGIGMTVFTITGHTGFRGVVDTRTASSAGTLAGFVSTAEQVVTNVLTGGGVPPQASIVDGAAAIKDLQNIIDAYFFPQGRIETREATQTQDLQLEFLNFMAPTSDTDAVGHFGWIIHPHRGLVNVRQDASKPFLYAYQFQFAGIAPLDDVVRDLFQEEMTNPRTTFRQTMDQLNAIMTRVTNGVNTIVDAFDQMVIQQVTGPVSTFIAGANSLGNALGNFVNAITTKIQFPLYAQREFAHVLDAPRHSVTTLAAAAKQLGAFLVEAADPRSIGRTLAGETLTGGVNDDLTLSVNNERPVTLHLGTQTSGTAIAATIQAQMRAQMPEHAANASAYRDFTATFTDGQYRLSSGTKLSDAASVRVLVSPDLALTPTDASGILGLGVANGGQEHVGSAYPLPALALLRGAEEACAHLQAFPDFFADQLDAQDAALAALLPPGSTRPHIRGDQHLQQTRITPGDSLQSIAARVGVPWETLALVNRLTYPYLLESPTTLLRGRASGATLWTLIDQVQAWPVNAYQGQRLDIVAGPGAGQSRAILRNTATELVLDTAWGVLPSDLSDYAIQAAVNPILGTGTTTSSTTRTLTNGALDLVPDSRRGVTLVVTSGPSAGTRRRIVTNDATTYTVDTPWDVPPPPSSLYLLLGPAPATRRQKVVGEWLSVPRPSAQAVLPIRSRLQDVSAITGRALSVEDKLFGRDLVLDEATQRLVYDAALGDAVSLAGLANLRQAVVHLVNLPIGELEYQPGLGSFIQEELGLIAALPLQNQVLASVQRTIRQDARVARMNGARLITQGGTSVITFGVTAIDGSTIDRVTIR